MLPGMLREASIFVLTENASGDGGLDRERFVVYNHNSVMKQRYETTL